MEYTILASMTTEFLLECLATRFRTGLVMSYGEGFFCLSIGRPCKEALWNLCIPPRIAASVLTLVLMPLMWRVRPFQRPRRPIRIIDQ
ncbi:hypothetical protein [Culex mononega-like virus 1]|nr:hypothetical protein [Culex mononega-like virus 1]ASA47371.1 hypothetical protein [Culex mononega-like virus 1]ASA47466.1 hypothetical protein [Culex mononega-like virus 1]